MSFMSRKKRYKFQVDLMLEELTAVSFVNGVLFAKVRLLDGGTFLEMSPKEEVKENCVKWNRRFRFGCKMSANSGVLESCICRISVRKEVRGGKSFEKLGFANLNLAEFAGAGITSRRYLLEGYNSRRRQDNSMLQVTLEMILLAGDPCFKTPFRQLVPHGDKPEMQLAVAKKGDDYSGDSVASGSSGFGSLPRKQQSNVLCSDSVAGTSEEKDVREEELPSEFELGHSRNSSYASQQSKASGYCSLTTHSRQSSAESGHMRNLSSSSTFSDLGLIGIKVPDRKRPSKKQVTDESRMDSTRVCAKKVINEMFETTDLEPDESVDSPGLQLFIKNDGTPALGCFEEIVARR